MELLTFRKTEHLGTDVQQETDEDEAVQLTVADIQSLNLAEAVSSGTNNATHSLLELSCMLRSGVLSKCTKDAKNKLMNECVLAMRHMLMWGEQAPPKQRRASHELASSVEAQFPVQKRKECMQVYRRVQQLHKRCSRKQRASKAAVLTDKCNEDNPHVGDRNALPASLPADPLRYIMHKLDAPTLATAACVCRSWRKAALDNDIWHMHSLSCFGVRVSNNAWRSHWGTDAASSWKTIFHELRQRWPARVTSSSRIMCPKCRTLAWAGCLPNSLERRQCCRHNWLPCRPYEAAKITAKLKKRKAARRHYTSSSSMSDSTTASGNSSGGSCSD